MTSTERLGFPDDETKSLHASMAGLRGLGHTDPQVVRDLFREPRFLSRP